MTERAREEARKIVAEHLGKYGPGSTMEEEIATALLAAEQRGEAREREACALECERFITRNSPRKNLGQFVIGQSTASEQIQAYIRKRGESHDQG